MTEKEWLEASDPEEMLVSLGGIGASERKARLFMCACRGRQQPPVLGVQLNEGLAKVIDRVTTGCRNKGILPHPVIIPQPPLAPRST